MRSERPSSLLKLVKTAFDPRLIEDVFLVEEYASIQRDLLNGQSKSFSVQVSKSITQPVLWRFPSRQPTKA